MMVHVKHQGARIEFDERDTFTYDEELAAMGKELQTMELVMASRPLRGMAPVLDEDDGGNDGRDELDFTRAFVERADR